MAQKDKSLPSTDFASIGARLFPDVKNPVGLVLDKLAQQKRGK